MLEWWRDVAELEEDSFDILTPVEAGKVWLKISPVLHTLLQDINENYWGSCLSILKKLLPSDEIPNPEINFEKFVEFLYQNQLNLKFTTIAQCKNFVESFYTDGDLAFFVSTFLFVVSDPMLCLETYRTMFYERFPPFISWLMLDGTIEKLLSMFITFLTPYKNKSHKDILQYRIILSDLIVEILVSNTRPIAFFDDILSMYFSKCLNLINYSDSSASICFARNIVRITEIWFPMSTREQAETRISTMITSAPLGKSSHEYIVRYAVKQAGKYISHNKLANLLSKQGFRNPFDLEVLRDLAIADPSSCAPYIVHFLSRAMTAHFAFINTSAVLLSEVLEHCDSKEVTDWMKRFVTMTFIFLKVACEQDAFARRVRAICEALTSDVFKQFQWFTNIVNSCANAAYAIDNQPEIFRAYFHIGEKFPSASFFRREYEKFSPLLKNRRVLKMFPFKGSTVQLMKATDKDEADDDSQREIDDSLKELGLGPRALRYVYFDFDAGPIDQQQSIFLLEDFIDHEKMRFGRTEYYKDNYIRIKMDRFIPEGRLEMAGMRAAVEDLEETIWQYQINALKDFIAIAKELIGCLKQHPHLIANIKALNRDLNTGCSDDQAYKVLKKQRHRLKRVVEASAKRLTAPNYAVKLKQYLMDCFYNFEPTTQYAPPSLFDGIVDKYLLFSIKWSPTTQALGEIIASEAVDAAASTLWELASVIYEKTEVSNETTLLICYTAVVRMIFDRIYDKYHPLAMYEAANVDFLSRCITVAENQLSTLDLDKLLSYKAGKGTISSFFRSKNQNLGSLEFLVNPIDIMYKIHQTVMMLGSIFPGVDLTNDEKVKLLKGLIATFPPSNTISIIRFIDTWSSLTPSNNIIMSFSLFRKACISM